MSRGIKSEHGLLVGGENPSGAAGPLKVDTNGYLYVNLTNGGGGGVAYTDQTAFTAGVSAGTPLMAEDPTSGQLLVAQMSPGTRKLLVSASVTSSPVTASTVNIPAIQTITTGSNSVLSSNASRLKLTLQNIGTTTLYILFGAGMPSATVFHLALPPGGSAKDGFSAPYIDIMWIGAVQAASSAAGGSLMVGEFTA